MPALGEFTGVSSLDKSDTLNTQLMQLWESPPYVPRLGRRLGPPTPAEITGGGVGMTELSTTRKRHYLSRSVASSLVVESDLTRSFYVYIIYVLLIRSHPQVWN